MINMSGNYHIKYSTNGILFIIKINQTNEISFTINDISVLKQINVIIDTYIKQKENE